MGGDGRGDSLGAVELEAAMLDVCLLVASDAAAAVDWCSKPILTYADVC